ncbi:MAG TPA: trimethylamine corrinoid protein 2 [Clostridia bacterium]|nr:trimethylamine corrinoid protein 2 [Clostridia bacterium]
MIGQDLNYLMKRSNEYWNKENHDRPIMSIHAPKAEVKIPDIKVPDNIWDRWLDIDYILKSHRAYFETTYFGGEAFPAIEPNLGPDILGAIVGCELEFSDTTSWARHFVEDWNKVPDLKLNSDNKWWKKIKEITEAAVNDANGDYLVGVTDLHAGTDGLVSMRGPENVCLDIIDYPNQIKKFNLSLLEVFKDVYNGLYSIITKKQQGVTNWMGIWHPEKWYVTSSDFSCLVSESDFEEFIIPELMEEINFLDASIYHLDGPGALRHLDRLLKIEKLKGIQWVYGAGQPTARYWIDILKKIQDAGKLIHISIEPSDFKPLCEALKPEGVNFVCNCTSESEAKDMIKFAEKFYFNKKLY